MATLQQQNIHPVLSLTWDLLAQPVISAKRKTRLRQEARRYQYSDRLATRVETKSYIDFCKTADGFIYVENFARDCDNCERRWVEKIPAHITALSLHENRLQKNAEGLTYCALITEGVAEVFEPTVRDRNAERGGY